MLFDYIKIKKILKILMFHILMTLIYLGDENVSGALV